MPLSKRPFSQQHESRFQALQRQKLPSYTCVFAWLIMMAIAMTVFVLFLVPWIQTAAGRGVITTLNPNDRAQAIHALVSGRIQQWYVQEGSSVKQGDPIVRLVDNDPQLIERLEEERRALEQNVSVANIAAETAEINFKRQEELFEKGLSSRKEYEDAKIKYKSLLAKHSTAQASLNQAKTRLARQQIQTITAPRDGVILRITAGDIATIVKSGEPIATFVPSNVPLAVEMYVDGLDVPLITQGRKVRLQFEGWPAVQFSGWPSVAVGTFGGVVIGVDPVVSPNGKFRVMIIPDPEDIPWPDEKFLNLGAQAKGWVLLETVSVGYELWRQLNHFPPQYPPAYGHAVSKKEAKK